MTNNENGRVGWGRQWSISRPWTQDAASFYRLRIVVKRDGFRDLTDEEWTTSGQSTTSVHARLHNKDDDGNLRLPTDSRALSFSYSDCLSVCSVCCVITVNRSAVKSKACEKNMCRLRDLPSSKLSDNRNQNSVSSLLPKATCQT